MAPTLLPDLLPELIIHIYKFMHNFKDASNLSKTSHQMHDLFITNIISICKAILPRAIDSYAQACDLLAAQQEYTATNPPLVEPAQAMIHRVRWLLSEAHTAQRALQFFEDAIFRPIEAKSDYSNCYGCRVLHLTERSDFTRAYYRVMTLVTSAGTSYSPETPDSWDMPELIQFGAVLTFLMYSCPPENRVWKPWCSAEMNQILENQASMTVLRSKWCLAEIVTERLTEAIR
jgi:hypothetical protein